MGASAWAGGRRVPLSLLSSLEDSTHPVHLNSSLSKPPSSRTPRLLRGNRGG